MAEDWHPVLFAGVDLARRVERAEQTLVAQAAAATADLGGSEDQLVLLPVAGGLAAWAGGGSPFNKVVGAGFGQALDGGDLDALEAIYAARATPVQFEVSTLADPAIVERLTGRGYRLTGFEHVLGLPLRTGRTVTSASDVVVRRVAVEDDLERARWLRVDVEGSAVADTDGAGVAEQFPRAVVELAVESLASTDGFVAALAELDGAPAGSGSLRLDAGIAQLCGAATLPAFRRRGVQSTLLSWRLAAAASAGCDLAVVTVQPGSKSQQNAQRLGFQVLYARSILVQTIV